MAIVTTQDIIEIAQSLQKKAKAELVLTGKNEMKGAFKGIIDAAVCAALMEAGNSIIELVNKRTKERAKEKTK